MRTSESIVDISTALSKAQASFLTAKKTALNPHFKKHYADLADVIDATKEALGKNDLAITQGCHQNEKDQWVLVTKMVHKSGQWFESEFPLLSRESTAQAMGSAVKYARRYAYEAMTGVAAEDDDGNAASGKGENNANTSQGSGSVGQGSSQYSYPTNDFDQRPIGTAMEPHRNTAPLPNSGVESTNQAEPGSLGELRFLNGIYEGATYAQALENEKKLDFKWSRNVIESSKKGPIPKSYDMFLQYVRSQGKLLDT